ncbi:putative MFS transporter [Rhizodiscina lignyota]|uniref:Efflux pump dotC n=1 Tax=Rhizodiscina lignyota TaxID=1504668 RepID=A0A9P4IH22_9PEZI|nr:putative MFS transporter [Rhizodiscina lignyota]
MPQSITASQQGSLAEIVVDQPNIRSKARVLAILAALYLSLFVAALDQTIIATAIPTISNQLHGSSGFVWIGGAYLLANAAAAPIWAKLSDIWGRKPILLLVVAWFFGSSIICATAKSMNVLIIGRAFQGTAGGGLIQLVNITLSDLFSMRSRALYIGLLETMWCVAGGIGPILGGTFAELISWRWAFWINLPVSGSTFFLLLFFLDVHNPRTNAFDGIKAIDWFGSFSILGLTVMFLLGLNFGGEAFPWSSPQVICLIVFGALMSVLFIFSEKKLARYPLMPPNIFSHRSNISTLLVTFFHGITFIGAEFYLPLYFQSVRQASPLKSGVLVLPFIVLEALMGITAGVIIHQTGRYLELIYVGLFLLTLGGGLYILFDAHASLAKIIIIEIVAGIGGGLLFEPPLIALQAMVRQDEVATATGTLGFIRNLACSLGVVIGGVIFQNGMETRSDSLRAAGLPPDLLNAFSGHDAEANVLLVGSIQNGTQKMAVKEAYAGSLKNVWIFYTCTAACALLCSVFIARAVLSTEHVETKTGLKEKEMEDNGAQEMPAETSIELQQTVA